MIDEKETICNHEETFELKEVEFKFFLEEEKISLSISSIEWNTELTKSVNFAILFCA